MASLTQQIVIVAAVDLYMYSYYQTICKQLDKCVSRKIGYGKRVFPVCFQWLVLVFLPKFSGYTCHHSPSSIQTISSALALLSNRSPLIQESRYIATPEQHVPKERKRRR